MSEYGLLNPGTKYQLTDYECIVNKNGWRANIKSAGHRFDLIITANTPEILNHECSATYHDFSDEIKQCEDEIDELNEIYDDLYDYENVSFNEKIEYYTSKLNIIDEDINEIDNQIDEIKSKPDFNNSNDYQYDVEILYLKKDELDKQSEKIQNIIDFYENLQDYVSNDNIEGIDTMREDFEKIMESKNDEFYKLEEESYYFEKCDLNLWKIWYILDNEFQSNIYCEWYYNVDEGKGVIYRMIDEYNNDVGYDFKNILMPVTKITRDNIYNLGYIPSFYENIITKLKDNDWSYVLMCDGNFYEGYSLYCYTFSDYYDEYGIRDNSVRTYSMCFNNKIISHNEEYTEFSIPNVIFMGYVIFNNYVGINCQNIILNEMCAYNEIIYSCEYIYMDEGCVLNKIVNESEEIYLGERCAKNVFENECFNIILDEDCSGNTFRPDCSEIFLMYGSSNNLFDTRVERIELMGESYNNIFKQKVNNIKLDGIDLYDCIFEDVEFLIINHDEGIKELRKCYLYNIQEKTLNQETFIDNRKCESSILHIENNGEVVWSDETLDIIERLKLLEEENENLKTRLQTLEDNFEQMVTQVIDNYQFRTVCKYDIRGTGNINIVAASTLQD